MTFSFVGARKVETFGLAFPGPNFATRLGHGPRSKKLSSGIFGQNSSQLGGSGANSPDDISYHNSNDALPYDESQGGPDIFVDTIELSFPVDPNFSKERFHVYPGKITGESLDRVDKWVWRGSDAKFSLTLYNVMADTGVGGGLPEYEIVRSTGVVQFQVGSPHHLAVADRWDEVCAIATPQVSLSDAKVTRLDVARDFDVASPAWWLERHQPTLWCKGRADRLDCGRVLVLCFGL